MKSIELEPDTYDDLCLLASAWQVDEGQAVTRLIANFRSGADATRRPRAKATSTWIPVHADYSGTRVTAEFDPSTEAVRILAGIQGTGLYKSPSGAAIAVITELNPRVNPNRNGWGFWNVTDSGEILQKLRRS